MRSSVLQLTVRAANAQLNESTRCGRHIKNMPLFNYFSQKYDRSTLGNKLVCSKNIFIRIITPKFSISRYCATLNHRTRIALRPNWEYPGWTAHAETNANKMPTRSLCVV